MRLLIIIILKDDIIDYITLSRDDTNNTQETTEVEFGHIESGQSVTKPVYIHARDLPGVRVVSFTVTYILFLFFIVIIFTREKKRFLKLVLTLILKNIFI